MGCDVGGAVMTAKARAMILPLLAGLAIGAALVACYVIGQQRQAAWCAAHVGECQR